MLMFVFGELLSLSEIYVEKIDNKEHIGYVNNTRCQLSDR